MEKLICELQKVGLGRVAGSSMSVLPLSVHFAPISEEEKKNCEKMAKFYASIKSRRAYVFLHQKTNFANCSIRK